MTADRREDINLPPDGATDPPPGLLQTLARHAAIEVALTEYRQVLEQLPDEEVEGECKRIRRRVELLDPTGRPDELEPEGGAAITWPPAPRRKAEPHPLLAQPQHRWFHDAAIVLHELHLAGRHDEMRLTLSTLDPVLCQKLLDEQRHWYQVELPAKLKREAEERAAREAQERAEGARLAEEHREAWRAFLAQPQVAASIEALKRSKPPTDLPRDGTMWAVVDPSGCGDVVGLGGTIGEAHEDALLDELPCLTLEYLGDREKWDSLPEESRWPPFCVTSRWHYVRIQGSSEGVCALLELAEQR